ncbi:MAG TPA: OmpA family protein [Syntrophorhabdaceae bacterium]|jgi:peptidoglycan-associated lipoprotein
MKYLSLLLIPLMLYGVFGCAPKTVMPERAAVTTSPDQGAAGAGDKERGRERGISEEDLATRAERERLQRLRQEKLDQDAKSALFKDIRFDYDSYSVKADDIPRLRDIGKWLSENRTVGVTVEGHCDERGTQEYNLMLGQKRAEVVKDYLVKAGVDEKRIKAVSFGKEAPIDPGHSEEAFAKNRRAHLNIEQKG